MTSVTFDVTKFRAMYPQFADPVEFPDVILQGFWDLATCYMSDENYGILQGNCRQNALNMLTAHLAGLSGVQAAGEITNVIQNAVVDKTQVGFVAPPIKNSWQYWLNETPYGQQFLALMCVLSAGGFYIGGLPEKSAFRKVYGIF